MSDDNHASASKAYPFKFTGSGGEFFKIWLVNILLTIITVGIYSAWAKVRTLRYFYGNTILHQASFEYLASPVQILKGRIIAVVLFIVFGFVSSLNPLIAIALLFLFMFATPYIVIRAIRFQHRMSAYKNIRFDFDGQLGEGFMVYLVWPFLSTFTAGLLYPFVHQKLVAFYMSNSRYGTAQFKSTADIGSFYKLYLILFAMIVGVIVLGAIIISTMGMSFSQDVEAFKEHSFTIIAGAYGAMFVLYFIIYAFVSSLITNLIMNTLILNESIHFRSKLPLLGMAWLLFTNTLLIVFTLGLAYPWAKVRLAHYRAERTHVVTAASLDEFLGSDVANSTALGDEVAGMFDVDVAV